MIGAFFVWWFEQLASLLPSWLRRAASMRADALMIGPGKRLGEITCLVASLRRSGREAPLGEFAPGAAELAELPHSRSRPAVLRLSTRDVLEKTLVLPIAAQAQLDQVLAFEMDRETPFTPEELYWNHRVEAVDRQHGRLTVRLWLLPKATLAPLLAELGRVGIVPRWAEIGDGIGEIPDLPLDRDSGSRRPRDKSRLLWPAAVCCAALALGAIVTPFARQSTALAVLDREVGEGQAAARRAEALRQEIDRLSHSADLVKNAFDKAGRPLEVLATVTRLLPDDTYLTELDLQQRKLTISGRSAAAARLIGAFAADGKFRNPTFAAPVTRVEALRAEVFTIVADVGAGS